MSGEPSRKSTSTPAPHIPRQSPQLVRESGLPRGQGKGQGQATGAPERGQLGRGSGRPRGNASATRAGPGGYLAEEAGDHLLEGVLVHLAYVHRDPHPRTPGAGCAAAAGVHTRPTKGAWEVFSSLFKLSKLYCPPGGTDRRWRPAPFRQRGAWAARAVSALQEPGVAGWAAARALRPRPLRQCFPVVTSTELRTQQP